jgi:hypothetical protein
MEESSEYYYNLEPFFRELINCFMKSDRSFSKEREEQLRSHRELSPFTHAILVVVLTCWSRDFVFHM